jgi:hypothetical protein
MTLLAEKIFLGPPTRASGRGQPRKRRLAEAPLSRDKYFSDLPMLEIFNSEISNI